VLRGLVDAFPFNDLAGLDAAFDRHPGDVAAVILEIGAEEPAPGFLASVKERAHRAGAVLIFDEIVTGFRFALGGAQEHYGVVPDLACLGKAIANGFPVAAVVGRAELMCEFERVFFSGTFGGEAVSLAAAKATISELRDRPVIDHLWTQGGRLRAGLQELITSSGLDVVIGGHPPRSWLFFRRDGEDWPALRGLFLQETVRRGVLFGGPIFLTYAHEDADIDRTLEICDQALTILRAAVETESVEDRLDGPPPSVVFRPARS
jgi:glutamate-1-semialdehyde aminotransferase